LQIFVAGDNLFCGSALRTKEFPNGIPRIKMPQFSGFLLSGRRLTISPHVMKKGKVDGGPEFIDQHALWLHDDSIG